MKKMTMRRISALAAVSLCLAAASAVSAEDKSITSESAVSAVEESADMETVLTINGFDIPYDEYYSYLAPYKAKVVEEGEDISDKEVINAVVEKAESDLLTNYELMKWAMDEGFAVGDISDDEYEEAYASELADAGSEEALKKRMSDNYMSEEIYEQRLRQEIVKSKLRSFVYSEGSPYVTAPDEELKKLYDDYGFYSTRQIMIFSSDDAEKDREKKEKVLEVMKKLEAGEDFDKLQEAYNEDPNVTPSNDVYIARTGDLFPEYEEAARALEIGETSSIITTQVGYHIIMRIEPPEDLMREQMGYYYENYAINDKMASLGENVEIEYPDNYEELVLKMF